MQAPATSSASASAAGASSASCQRHLAEAHGHRDLLVRYEVPAPATDHCTVGSRPVERGCASFEHELPDPAAGQPRGEHVPPRVVVRVAKDAATDMDIVVGVDEQPGRDPRADEAEHVAESLGGAVAHRRGHGDVEPAGADHAPLAPTGEDALTRRRRQLERRIGQAVRERGREPKLKRDARRPYLPCKANLTYLSSSPPPGSGARDRRFLLAWGAGSRWSRSTHNRREGHLEPAPSAEIDSISRGGGRWPREDRSGRAMARNEAVATGKLPVVGSACAALCDADLRAAEVRAS